MDRGKKKYPNDNYCHGEHKCADVLADSDRTEAKSAIAIIICLLHDTK